MWPLPQYWYTRRHLSNQKLQLLEINLTRNDFEFNEKYFLQIKGTSKMQTFLWLQGKLTLGACDKKPLHYYRYLNDIWGVLTYSEEEFTIFLCTLNNHNPSIKLKAISLIQWIFLIQPQLEKFTLNNQLNIKLQFKGTDTHALLPKHSNHPKHTFAGLITSQLSGFYRICSQRENFKQATKVLFSALSSRG